MSKPILDVQLQRGTYYVSVRTLNASGYALGEGKTKEEALQNFLDNNIYSHLSNFEIKEKNLG